MLVIMIIIDVNEVLMQSRWRYLFMFWIVYVIFILPVGLKGSPNFSKWIKNNYLKIKGDFSSTWSEMSLRSRINILIYIIIYSSF